MCIYQVFGEELEKTTLKSLGLTKGRAMLRLLHRDPNQKKEQAHIYIPKKVKNTTDEYENPSSSIANYISNKILDPIRLIKVDIDKKKKENKLRNSHGKDAEPCQIDSNLTYKRYLENSNEEESNEQNNDDIKLKTSKKEEISLKNTSELDKFHIDDMKLEYVS